MCPPFPMFFVFLAFVYIVFLILHSEQAILIKWNVNIKNYRLYWNFSSDFEDAWGERVDNFQLSCLFPFPSLCTLDPIFPPGPGGFGILRFPSLHGIIEAASGMRRSPPQVSSIFPPGMQWATYDGSKHSGLLQTGLKFCCLAQKPSLEWDYSLLWVEVVPSEGTA